MLEGRRIAFLGAGNMAEAIARGLLKADDSLRRRITASDVSPERRTVFEEALGVSTSPDNAQTVRAGDILVLAVKPQNLAGLLDEVGLLVSDEHLVLSIVAGVRTADIESRLGPGARVVRAMPNTPLLVGEGACAVAPGKRATEEDLRDAKELLGCAGRVVEVDEGLLDAVTALSGSGPAYFFYFLESLVDAAVELGMDRSTALELATQTMLGSARLLEETGLPPHELRRRVTSLGGTTAAAVEVFDKGELGAVIGRALRRAAERSGELADEFSG